MTLLLVHGHQIVRYHTIMHFTDKKFLTFKKLLYFVVTNNVINVEDVLNCKLNAGYAEIQLTSFLTKKTVKSL